MEAEYDSSRQAFDLTEKRMAWSLWEELTEERRRDGQPLLTSRMEPLNVLTSTGTNTPGLFSFENKQKYNLKRSLWMARIPGSAQTRGFLGVLLTEYQAFWLIDVLISTKRTSKLDRPL